MEGRVGSKNPVETSHLHDPSCARIVRHEDEGVAAALQTLGFPDEDSKRGRIEEADLGQVNKDRVRPHGASFLDPSLEALGGVGVELTRHRDECELARKSRYRRTKLVQVHAASVRRTPQAALQCFVSVCLQRQKLVAAAANRHQPLRVGRVALDLAADVRDVQVARPLVADVGAVPEVAHDLAP